jgi:hypothetical protein
MSIFCKNTTSGLLPLYDSDLEEKSKLKLGEIYEMTPKLWKERNLQFHKKYFALLKLGHDNTKLTMDLRGYRAYVTMKAGYAEVYKTPKGLMALPKSIAFDKMDDIEFEGLYNSAIQVIIDDIGATREDIEQNIINFL